MLSKIDIEMAIVYASRKDVKMKQMELINEYPITYQQLNWMNNNGKMENDLIDYNYTLIQTCFNDWLLEIVCACFCQTNCQCIGNAMKILNSKYKCNVKIVYV